VKKTRAIHPILIALFPVLFLYSQNMDGFRLRVIFMPAAVVVVFAVPAWALLTRVFKSSKRAALFVSLFLLLFFSYGHVYNATWHYFSVEPFSCGPGKVLFPTFGLLFVAGGLFIIRTRRMLVPWTRLSNLVSIVLVAVPLIGIGARMVTSTASLQFPEVRPVPGFRPDASPETSPPDIYYIILDGYARGDILQELYDYDNRTFLDELTARGFHVVTDAHANYCQTTLSLASSLNMRYLDPTTDHFDPDSDNRSYVEQMILQNEVHRFLHANGYTSAAFATGYRSTEIETVDVFREAGADLLFLDEFQNGLLNTTPLPAILNKLRRYRLFGGGIGHAQAERHRDQVLSVFRHLQRTRSAPQPQFVFAHIITPHPPFLFGRNGEHLFPGGVYNMADGNHLIGPYLPTRDEYVRKYVDQLIYINGLVLSAVDSILARSARPPVIILQSDHGPGSQLNWDSIDSTNVKERLSILNAYYLPEGGDALLYDGITPVNTFRLIFNRYLGTDYQLLDDRSYFSTWPQPFNFYDVTDDLKAEPVETTAHSAARIF